jgi:hypothetical protein
MTGVSKSGENYDTRRSFSTMKSLFVCSFLTGCILFRWYSDLPGGWTRTLTGSYKAYSKNGIATADAIRPSALDIHFGFITKNITRQVQNSKNATVMGMAYNYDVRSVKPFVETLRLSGYKGNIIMGISPEPREGLEDYLQSRNVITKKLKMVNCSNPIIKEKSMNSHQSEVAMCADPHPDLKIRWGRFALFKDYLLECEGCTGPVLIADVRDMFFQRDPFGPEAPPIIKGIQVFEEHRLLRTTNWLVQWPVEQCKKMKIFDEPMLCSGTTIGTRQGMLDYLTAMTLEMREWTKNPDCCCNQINGDDQSIHNYLFYTGKLPHAVAIANRAGIVNTVGWQGGRIWKRHQNDLAVLLNISVEHAGGHPYTAQEERDRGKWLGENCDQTDEQGYFLDFNGQRSFAIHQFDRYEWPLSEWLWKHGPLKGVDP